jgi:flagellin
MVNSINTNAGAIVGLQSLGRTNKELDVVQKRVSTGYRVADNLDDGASFAVAQGLRADVKAYGAVSEQLAKGKGMLTVASEAAKKISDTMGEVKKVLIKLSDDGLSDDERDQYEEDYDALRDEINRFIDQATFNGTNLLTEGADINIVSGIDGASSISATGYDLETDVYDELTDAGSASAAQTLLEDDDGFDTAMTNLNTALAGLGADSRSLDNQIDFINILSDATSTSLGAIVDADLAKESAALQSLQIKQQLATQTLAIANQSPSFLVSLFR